MASKALFAALDFDLFTRIEGGLDQVLALASATGISENRLVTLLAALKSVGLIAERGGRLINAPVTSKFLVAGAVGDFRDYVRLVNGALGYEIFGHLPGALRGERVFPDKGFMRACSIQRELVGNSSARPSIPDRSAWPV
jgi:hypothetical protein